MKLLYYFIDDKHNITSTSDVIEWAKNFDKMNRRVDRTYVECKEETVTISTVFLGIDHAYDSDIPILFETMIFGGKHNGYQERYSTWDEAVEGHKKAVQLVKDTEPKL